LHICDDKEGKLKEEIINLNIRFPELEKFNEGMRKQYQETENECERLDA